MIYYINYPLVVRRNWESEEERECILQELEDVKTYLAEFCVWTDMQEEDGSFVFTIRSQKVTLYKEEDCNSLLNVLDEVIKEGYSCKRIPQGEGLGLCWSVALN